MLIAIGIAGKNLESEIILKSDDPSICGKVAVGHVIASDFWSYSSPNRAVDLNSWRDDKETLPVILAVGSNYAQGSSYLTRTVMTFSPSGMAEELSALISRISSLTSLAAALKTDANLVLANFFPWITNRSLSSLSVFEQVVLLQSHGYANPIEVIGRLFLRLRPHLLAVIFHGGPDFVHVYASEWISTYVDADPTFPPLILFSDNLSGRSKIKGTTASLFI